MPTIWSLITETYTYYNISPSYSSSIYSRDEYNTLKWRSESIVYGNNVYNHKKNKHLEDICRSVQFHFLLMGNHILKKYLLIFYKTSVTRGLPCTHCDVTGNRSIVNNMNCCTLPHYNMVNVKHKLFYITKLTCSECVTRMHASR